MVEQKSYGAAVDIWSLGVITYILVTGAMPRDLWKSALKYGRVTEKDFGFDCYEWDTVSTKAREFVQACLAYKPSNRLSASAAGITGTLNPLTPNPLTPPNTHVLKPPPQLVFYLGPLTTHPPVV